MSFKTKLVPKDGIIEILEPNGVVVARVSYLRPQTATLLAAAPDLLEALAAQVGDLHMLKLAIKHGDPQGELLLRIADMDSRVRAAITKAKGETKL